MEFEDLRKQYQRWLVATQDLSEHTVRAYDSDVHALEQFLGASFDVSCLEAGDLHRFLEHLKCGGHPSSTIRRRLCGIRGFCSWLTRAEVMDTNPALDLDVRFSTSRRLPRAVSSTDLDKLVRHLAAAASLTNGPQGPETASHRSSETTTLLAVLLMVGTGMRVGELVQTKTDQVDLPSRTIRVLGKGLRERMVFLSNDWIVGLVRYYQRECVGRESESETLLVNRSGKPLTTGALRTRVQRAGTAAGIRNTLTPHMLRHTAATHLIETGVDIRFVQRLLGHASLTTTEIYTHVADRSLRNAVTQADVLGRLAALR